MKELIEQLKRDLSNQTTPEFQELIKKWGKK